MASWKIQVVSLYLSKLPGFKCMIIQFIHFHLQVYVCICLCLSCSVNMDVRGHFVEVSYLLPYDVLGLKSGWKA